MKKYYIYILLALVVVLFLRFNRQDLLIKDVVGIIGGDHHQYYAMVDYFRGQAPFWYSDAPFNKRLLVPLLAAALPFERGFSLNLINAILLYLGFAFAFRTLAGRYVKPKVAFYIVLLHIFCFPVFYYSVVGFVDAALVGWMMISLSLLLEGRYVWFCIAVAIGLFLKESIIIVFACGLLYFIFKRNWKQAVLLVLLYAVAYFLQQKIMQILNYGIPYTYGWEIELSTLKNNLARPRTYLSFLLSAYPSLIIFAIGIYFYFKKKFAGQDREIILLCFAGLALVLALYVYSLFVAYSDGRFIYPAIAFSIYLSGIIAKENAPAC
ncbi:MAG: hypothetical protein N3A67_05705 [Ignavibacteria bacterium]|nr:hypothetical protein [Ignavibacteria bacterium]